MQDKDERIPADHANMVKPAWLKRIHVSALHKRPQHGCYLCVQILTERQAEEQGARGPGAL